MRSLHDVNLHEHHITGFDVAAGDAITADTIYATMARYRDQYRVQNFITTPSIDRQFMTGQWRETDEEREVRETRGVARRAADHAYRMIEAFRGTDHDEAGVHFEGPDGYGYRLTIRRTQPNRVRYYDWPDTPTP